MSVNRTDNDSTPDTSIGDAAQEAALQRILAAPPPGPSERTARLPILLPMLARLNPIERREWASATVANGSGDYTRRDIDILWHAALHDLSNVPGGREYFRRRSTAPGAWKPLEAIRVALALAELDPALPRETLLAEIEVDRLAHKGDVKAKKQHWPTDELARRRREVQWQVEEREHALTASEASLVVKVLEASPGPAGTTARREWATNLSESVATVLWRAAVRLCWLDATRSACARDKRTLAKEVKAGLRDMPEVPESLLRGLVALEALGTRVEREGLEWIAECLGEPDSSSDDDGVA